MSPEAGPIHRKDETVNPLNADLAAVHANTWLTDSLFIVVLNARIIYSRESNSELM